MSSESQRCSPGRIGGIDYGTVRIGLAVTDPDRTMASPLEIYTRRNPQLDAKYFQQLAKDQRIALWVVGLPVHLDGRESGKSQEARRFGQWLAEITALPGRVLRRAVLQRPGRGTADGRRIDQQESASSGSTNWPPRSCSAVISNRRPRVGGNRGRWMTEAAVKLIVGCGYLGLRVARLWMAAGHAVAGLVRSPASAELLAREGVRPIVADVTQPSTLLDLPVADTLLYAVGYDPAGGASRTAVYVDGLRAVLDAVSPQVRRVILISSTGVYAEQGGAMGR